MADAKYIMKLSNYVNTNPVNDIRDVVVFFL